MFFKNGSENENKGDEMLVRNADKFSWFPHMWNHAQSHTYNNQSQLISDMEKNYQFAKVSLAICYYVFFRTFFLYM